jgi:hypothetical protein
MNPAAGRMQPVPSELQRGLAGLDYYYVSFAVNLSEPLHLYTAEFAFG